MTEQIEACPFCGSSNTGPGPNATIIECRRCGALGPYVDTAPKAIAAWNRRPSPWIKTADRPPPDQKTVLGYWGDGLGELTQASTYRIGDRWYAEQDRECLPPSHWMPLIPDPPKEDADDA